MKSLFLICALAVPPSMVDGPLHKIAAVKVFELLSRVHWDHPEREIDDTKRMLLVIGHETAVVVGLRSLGWNVFAVSPRGYADVHGTSLDRHFPFGKHVARIVFHSILFPDDPFELRQMIIDVSRTIEIGGYFIGPAAGGLLARQILLRNNFLSLPFGLFHRQKFYFIYQKQSAVHHEGRMANRRIEGAA